MSDGIAKGHEQHNEHSNQKTEMSRRQFLTYTLGATGGFLVAGVTIPMIRFAVDPLLEKKSGTDFVKVIEVSKLTSTPVEIKFQVNQVDGWVESNPELIAWLRKDESGNVLALSPVCKHLGCTVNFVQADNQYECPCHGAHYTNEGKNLKVAPLPLDEYTVKIENGSVYLGAIKPNHLTKA